MWGQCVEPQGPALGGTRRALEYCVRPQELALRRSRQVLGHCVQPQEPVLRGTRRALEYCVTTEACSAQVTAGVGANVFNHRSQRCEGLGGRCSTVFVHGSRLSLLHHHRRHIDHVCRHTRSKSRFSRKGWRELHHFHSLRKIHTASRGSSQTFGSLVALTRLEFWDLDDFLDELHLKNLHDLDDRHRRFLEVR